MSLDDAEELRGRAELLALIAKAEAGAKWTDLEELRERAELLGYIAKMEADAKWRSIEELRERAGLLERIARAEEYITAPKPLPRRARAARCARPRHSLDEVVPVRPSSSRASDRAGYHRPSEAMRYLGERLDANWR